MVFPWFSHEFPNVPRTFAFWAGKIRGRAMASPRTLKSSGTCYRWQRGSAGAVEFWAKSGNIYDVYYYWKRRKHTKSCIYIYIYVHIIYVYKHNYKHVYIYIYKHIYIYRSLAYSHLSAGIPKLICGHPTCRLKLEDFRSVPVPWRSVAKASHYDCRFQYGKHNLLNHWLASK